MSRRGRKKLKNPRIYGVPMQGKEFGRTYYEGSGSGSSAYDYGWPSGGTSESDVVMQYLFDEASGNITDEVNSVVLTANGTPTYEVAAASPWAGLSPGIRMGNPGDGYFNNASAQSDFDIGTNDFTWECVFIMDGSVTGTNQQFINNISGAFNGYRIQWTQSTSLLNLWIRFDVSNAVSVSTTINTMNDGDIHKLRIACDRDGDADFYYDGVLKGSEDISALDGDAINCGPISIGGSSASTAMEGVIFEMRLSLNLTNNSGGPGGG